MALPKIATCCYCGTRAALALDRHGRHELSCASCGAPLRQIKRLRAEPAAAAVATMGKRAGKRPVKMQKAPVKPKKAAKKRRKALWSKLLEEAWDTVEDIFD